MDVEKLLEYLRYIRSRIDALQGVPIIGLREIVPLQSELKLFRDRAGAAVIPGLKLRKHLGSADIHIAAVHLAGSKEHGWATWWMHLPGLRLLRPARQARDKEVIDLELARLRERLYDLYRLVEASRKS